MVNNGDFVLLDYSGRTKDGNVFDTTNAEEAKKAGVFNAKAKYGPVLIVVGSKQVLRGLDEALLSAVAGEEKTIELAPEKSFGNRVSDLVKLVPIARFREQNLQPQPGMILDFDGNAGKVLNAEGGRVQVDFNHPLAGQTVVYAFKIIKVFTNASEKTSAFVQDAFGKGVTAKVEGDSAIFTADATAAKGGEFIVAKMRAIQTLLQYVPEIKKVVFYEEYSKPEKLE